MSRGSNEDKVFSRRLSEVRAFEFNDRVARVFHDMISRSVPGYPLLLHMIGLYAAIFVREQSRVYDLGCSLGDATRMIATQVRDLDVEIIAIDNSSAMIERCREQGTEDGRIDWRCEDIRESEIEAASLVVLNLTLQFLQPEERAGLLGRVFEGLQPGGVLVLSEKVVFDSAEEDQRMVQLHQAFKKTMGYSDLEISQKRSALENVLIPDSEQLHIRRLRDIGFDEVYQCFRCFNFTSYLAIKG